MNCVLNYYTITYNKCILVVFDYANEYVIVSMANMIGYRPKSNYN